MYPKYCVLLLGLIFLGDSVSTKGYNEQVGYSATNDRPWREDDDIYIDDSDDSGQRGQDRWDDEDSLEASGSDEEGSGYEGSADGPTKPMTQCERVREQLRQQHMDAYIPRCRANGQFESEQCNYESGECWCVTQNGDKIPNTLRRTPHRPKCDGDAPVAPTRRPPKTGIDDSEEAIDIDESENTLPEGSSEPKSEEDNVIAPIPEIEETNGDRDAQFKEDDSDPDAEPIKARSIMKEPGILAGIIGGAVVGLLCAVLLVMFIVYRMRKKDEGSYALDEPKRSPQLGYTRARDREFFA